MRERETEKTSQELSISSNGLVHVPRAPRAKKQMYIWIPCNLSNLWLGVTVTKPKGQESMSYETIWLLLVFSLIL